MAEINTCMHKKFDSGEIEKKWQTVWAEQGLYDVGERDETKEKEYVLVEWPYPSGNLHIGHWYAFAVPDIYVRFQRMQGKQVLFPMGFDAFGLPAENAAIKRDINPREWTESNIAYMKEQLGSMGNAFSWDTTCSSTDPEYYKWTQWMFTKFFENDIAYRGEATVNWDPVDNTVIANEQVLADGTSERSGAVVEKKVMPQWMMRITDYADALVDDLDALDWPEHIKEAQRQWIGRSEGAEIDFTLSTGQSVTVFTTRPDTLFGATYLVLAPEHPLVAQNQATISNYSEVETYVTDVAKQTEEDRLNATKEKTGVKLEGITATNPANGEEIPVYIADYVLGSYGTGAIMAVPAHDERDHAFAEKFGIEIRQVVAQDIHLSGEMAYREDKETLKRRCVDAIIEHPTDGTFLLQTDSHTHFPGGGTDGEELLVALRREIKEETGFINYKIVKQVVDHVHCTGYRIPKDKNQITDSAFYHVKLTDLEQVPSEIEDGKHTVAWVKKEHVLDTFEWPHHRSAWLTFCGEPFTESGILCNSNEFDGMDSEEAKAKITKKVGGRMCNTYRLRDWSVGRQRYWGVPIPIVYDPNGQAHPVPEEHLPWTLPEDVDFKPTGEAPLAKSTELKARTEAIFGPGWTPEVETMDTFVDSSWYFLRYLDNKNDENLSSLSKQKQWLPIDIYFGGAEHTTMHLLYSRFWQKALHKLGLTEYNEPYAKRINRGLILGPDGNKMSKSKGNVIDPDEQVTLVGADTVKMYLAFMGPYEGSNYPWDMGGIAGMHRFLERVNGLSEHISEATPLESQKVLHKTIKKVTEDVAVYKFNTAISALMVCLNTIEKTGVSTADYKLFLRTVAPFTAHLSEELWQQAGETESIHLQAFPTYDADLATDTEVTIGVQVNGKVRGDITVAPDASEETALATAKAHERIAQYLEAGTVTKVIYKPGKILNLIVTT